VRKSVGHHVLANRDAVWIDQRFPHWIDAHAFEEACRRLQTETPVDAAARRSLRKVVHLYGEGFLADFPETDAALFEEWVQQQRGHYRRLAIDALQRLAIHALVQNDLDIGIED